MEDVHVLGLETLVNRAVALPESGGGVLHLALSAAARAFSRRSGAFLTPQGCSSHPGRIRASSADRLASRSATEGAPAWFWSSKGSAMRS